VVGLGEAGKRGFAEDGVGRGHLFNIRVLIGYVKDCLGNIRMCPTSSGPRANTNSHLGFASKHLSKFGVNPRNTLNRLRREVR
jgi:hypothetical protein